MKQHLKNFFIPHEGNDYHPHILHTKRAIFYAGFFLFLKGMVFVFVLMLPSVVFVMPDVLAEEESKLLSLTNDLRVQKGIAPMKPVVPLHVSANYKAKDMAALQYFSHISPQKHGLAYFLKQAGYSYDTAGENLAMGFSSARDIFDSWVKSPTHYANLIDPEFTEFDLSMESGLYDNMDTVYVAQHFGHPKSLPKESFPEAQEKQVAPSSTLKLAIAPKTSASSSKFSDLVVAAVPALSLSSDSSASSSTSTLSGVALDLIEKAVTPIVVATLVPSSTISLVTESSFVNWQDLKTKTNFTAEVKLDLKNTVVASAEIQIQDQLIPLKVDKDGIYRGKLLVNKPVDTFFDPIVEPTLLVKQKTGEIFKSAVSWKSIKLVAPTPMEKYTRAREINGLSASVFHVSRMIYLFFAGFFSIALFLMICIEIKQQQHHITVQTIGLIFLILSLFLV